MKIGLDIHGVITKHPKFFSELTKLFKEAGHEVHILTGSSLNPDTKYGRIALDELKKYGIHYTHLYSIIDHQEKIGTEIVYEDDENPWIDDDLWNCAKGDYCKEHNIDIMFDDTRAYADYFDTPFVHFLSIKKEN
jgi:hypothetical protein